MHDPFEAFVHARGRAGYPPAPGPPPLPWRPVSPALPVRKAAAPPPMLSAPAAPTCPHCQADLDRLPPTARFCARCGGSIKDLRRTRPGTAPSAAPRAAGQFAVGDEAGHSLMLEGYANAMYNLGRRYESSLGSRHHPEEALRCYYKAARLGNASAVARLGPQSLQAQQTEAPPPPLLGAAPRVGPPPL